MKHLIYGLVDPRDQLIHYVGKSSSGLARPRLHRYPRAHGANCATWIKSLATPFEIVVLESVADPNAPGTGCWWWTGINTTAMCDAERWWIAYGQACGWPLTNSTAGGDGSTGYRRSSESREKLSGDANPSKRPEVRAKIRAVKLAQWRARGASLGMTGRRHSPETIVKMREARTRWHARQA